MTNHVLVTGGAGFIGSHLIRKLLDQNYCKITVIDILRDADKMPSFMSDSLGNRVCYHNVNIMNKDALMDILKDCSIDTCVHLAAKVSVVDSIFNPADTIDINVRGTLNVLEACSKNNIKTFIFASSAAAYGEPRCLPIPEDHPSSEPLSPYGASKGAGEALAASYEKCGKLDNVISLRFFNVYGERQSGTYAGVITKFAERLSEGLRPIIYGDGQQKRDFIHVTDVTNAIIKAIEARTTGVFNIGTGKPITINELAEKMIDIFGEEVEPLYRPLVKGDIRESYADTARAKHVLKFNASTRLESHLSELKSHYAWC